VILHVLTGDGLLRRWRAEGQDIDRLHVSMVLLKIMSPLEPVRCQKFTNQYQDDVVLCHANTSDCKAIGSRRREVSLVFTRFDGRIFSQERPSLGGRRRHLGIRSKVNDLQAGTLVS